MSGRIVMLRARSDVPSRRTPENGRGYASVNVDGWRGAVARREWS